MLVRLFSSTSGQNMAKLLGSGTLPAPLVAKAQAAADQIVTSNCVGSDRKIVTSTSGGPYWPTAVPAPTSPIKECVAVATPSTTTVAGGSGGPTGSASSGGGSSSFNASGGSTSSGRSSGSTSAGSRNTVGYSGSSSSGGASDTAVLGTSTEYAGGTSAGTSSGSASPGGKGAAATAQNAAASLPLPLPDDGRKTLDRLATMLMGGIAFLFVRGAVRRRQVGA